MPKNFSCVTGLNINQDIEHYVECFTTMANSIGYIAYLIDEDNSVLAISEGFRQKFEISQDSDIIHANLANPKNPLLRRYERYIPQLKKQNEHLCQAKNKRIYLEIFNSEASNVDINILHKTPIYNLENKLICIHVLMRPFVIIRLANLAKRFLNIKGFPINKKQFELLPELSKIQKMVLYLYARNYSYTEVSIWLNQMGHNVSPFMVNKHLHNLKILFGVTNNEELRDISLKIGYDVAIPSGFIPEGIFDITDDVFDLWVC